jgi:hypothetical protein
MAGADMTIGIFKKILIGAFLAAFIILLGSFNSGKPRILVLHSFSKNLPWCRDVDAGIQKVLKSNRNPVSVSWHYLDFDTSKTIAFQQNSIQEALRAIQRIKPDILIAVDDESNSYIASSFAGKSSPKVVFVAALQPPEQYGYAGAGNVSGIKELLPLAAVHDALLTARKGKAARIAVIGMDDDTGRAELDQVRSFSWAPHRLTLFQAHNNFAEWQKFTQQAADQADVLLVLSYGGLELGNGDHALVPRGQIGAWIEKNSRALPLGICETFVEDGGGLGVTPAPIDFGQQAMQMALKWVEAPKGAAPPPVTFSPHFRIGLRSSVLAVRGIEMPPIYVEAARIGNAYFP